MKINWKNWKVGAAIGFLVLISLCVMIMIDNGFVLNSTGRFWKNISFDALIVFIISLLSLLVWAVCLPKSWKLRLAFLALIVPGLYFIFLGKDEVGCNCALMPPPTAAEVKETKEVAYSGGASAQLRLAEFYEFGAPGLEKNYAEAMKWYRAAAEKGNPYAEYQVGKKYESNFGLKQDYAEAAKWFRKAADQGNTLAADSLSNLYLKGYGVKQDYAEALFWFAVSVGPIRDGFSITTDSSSLSSKGYSDKHLTTAQVTEVERHVEEWQKAHAYGPPVPLPKK